MPIIFAGAKKKPVPVAVDLQEEKEDVGALKALAGDIIEAVKSGEVDKLVSALKAFHLECDEYKDEE